MVRGAILPDERRLSVSARQALEMLTNDSAAELIMHGFTRRLLNGLVRTRLAMRYSAPLKVGNSTVEVTYMMITAAGRRALKANAAVAARSTGRRKALPEPTDPVRAGLD